MPVIPLLLLTGCFQHIAVNSIGGILDNGFVAINEEQDLKLAEQSIASDLKLLDALIKTDPGNEKFLLLASEGYSSYALGFVEDDSVERARLFYLRGRDYGRRVLEHTGLFADSSVRNLDAFRRSLRKLSKDDVPAVFWTALGWGSYISWSLTDPSALADLPKVEAMMQFVADHDSTFFYGGAYFFLGTIAGSKPTMLGGDPELSRTLFERCLKINEGKFLMTYLYYAKSYAVQMQDQELFTRCLTTIDSTSIDALPDARLSNAIAKRKARLLKERMHELF